jgi:hypothetical protein
MNFSTGQRLAGPYSAPGFRPKIGPPDYIQAKFFLHRFNFVWRDEQRAAAAVPDCAQRGDEMQILMNLVRGGISDFRFPISDFGPRIFDQLANFRWRAFPHLTPRRGVEPQRRSKTNSATGRA